MAQAERVRRGMENRLWPRREGGEGNRPKREKKGREEGVWAGFRVGISPEGFRNLEKAFHFNFESFSKVI